MKVLKGDLTETRYAFPQDDEEEEGPMKVISERTYKENAVTYMADELGLHRVSNRGSDFAVSLHRTNPPFLSKPTTLVAGTDMQLCSLHSPKRSKARMPYL